MQIQLTPQTITSILNYCRVAADSYERFGDDTMRDVEFAQGDATVFVDFHASGHVEVEEIAHPEVPPPNVEILTTAVCNDVVIANVRAYDSDGSELQITNEEALTTLDFQT